MNQEAYLKIGRRQQSVIFKVSGRGTIRNSPPLENLALAALKEGEAKEIIIDLEDCLYMDSTFMGTLVGINAALLKKGNRKLIIVNANDRNKHLLSNLGLSRIMELRNKVGKFETEWELIVNAPLKSRVLAKHILAAHNSLEKIDAQSKARFSEVKRLLLESLSQEKPSASKG
ncbi:MAG: STAS domain-containing protein [Nitrospirae bacterium]|nr:STAS domain-containing protein [Nitrospirota bacterium]